MPQPPRLVYVSVEAKALTFYRCAVCGKEEQGDTVTVQRGVSAESFTVDRAFARHVRNNHMPTGWASYLGPAGDYHKCPPCQEK